MAIPSSTSRTLSTPRLLLRPPGERDVSLVCAGFRLNAARLAPWRAPRDETLTKTALWIAGENEAWERGLRRTFLILQREAGGKVLWGHVSLSELSAERQSATLGFWVDQAVEGQSVAFEALVAVLAFAYGELALHRVEAAVLPDNQRCRRLLERLGFHLEGTARGYLPVDGTWSDHLMFARLATDPR